MLCVGIIGRSVGIAARSSRALSTAIQRKPLSLEQALTSNHLIVAELEASHTVQHPECRVDGRHAAKWQATNAVLVHATLRILPQVGYTSDGAGLQAYSDGFAECLRDGSPRCRRPARAQRVQGRCC